MFTWREVRNFALQRAWLPLPRAYARGWG